MMLFRKKQKKSGFTLVELLVSVTLFAIVITIGISVFLNVVKSNNKARITSKLRNDAARVMEEMERDIKMADEVVVQDDNILYRINGNEFYTFQVVSVDDENDYMQKSQCTSLDLDSCTTVLYLMTPTDSNSGLNVSSDTSFAYLSHGEVKIVLVFEQPVGVPNRPDYQARVTLESSVVLRNY